MKSTLNISILLTGLALFFVGCSQNNIELPGAKEPGEQIPATTTIKNIVDNYIPDKNEMFGAYRIDSLDPLVINGIVISSDFGGNVYKYIIVKEEKPGGRAIRISIDAAGISAAYPLGQRVAVKMNDLYIGNYGKTPQVGVYYKRPQDGRIQVGAIPHSQAKYLYVFPYGTCEPKAVVADTMTIAEILSADREEMTYKLVCIKDAWFTGHGINNNVPDAKPLPAEQCIFAPGTNGKGFPQAREIKDATGSLCISTSEFAKFATKPLPDATIKGNVTAIVGWYSNSIAGEKPSGIYHQLTLRSLDDLGAGFEKYHESIRPKTK